METLSFLEKNDFLVRNKSEKYFLKDLELFKKYFPVHKLNNELARANQFTYERLDAQMIYSLLDVVPPEEILENRDVEIPVQPLDEDEKLNKIPEPPKGPGKGDNPKQGEDSAPLEALKERIQFLEESTDINTDDIDALRSELEDRDSSIEELQAKVEALEEKTLKKKEASGKSSLA